MPTRHRRVAYSSSSGSSGSDTDTTSSSSGSSSSDDREERGRRRSSRGRLDDRRRDKEKRRSLESDSDGGDARDGLLAAGGDEVPAPKRSRRRCCIIIAVILLLIGIGGGVFGVLKAKNNVAAAASNSLSNLAETSNSTGGVTQDSTDQSISGSISDESSFGSSVDSSDASTASSATSGNAPAVVNHGDPAIRTSSTQIKRPSSGTSSQQPASIVPSTSPLSSPSSHSNPPAIPTPSSGSSLPPGQAAPPKPGSPPPPPAVNVPAGRSRVFAYWRNWGSGMSDVTKIPYSKFARLFYFVAAPGPPASKGALTWGLDDGVVKQFTSLAHAAGCKASMTVGGWTDSKYFSDQMATAQGRTDFVGTLVSAMNNYGFDGIDIDWEYPGTAGIGKATPADTGNLLLFFQELRKAAPNAFLSAATSMSPWVDASGSASTDMSGFGNMLDAITIMTYDTVGPTSKITGPNIALSMSCAPDHSASDIPSAVQSWISAKFPAKKILMGLPSYGYVFTVASVVNNGVGKGGAGVYQNAIGTPNFNPLDYGDLVSKNYVNGKTAGPGWSRSFDTCTSTPWLFSSSTKQLIPYDDPDSLLLKAGYAKSNGLMGCNIFTVNGDNNGVLIAAIAAGC